MEPTPDNRFIHVLPDLPYQYDALSPLIDARTMELHHDCHHASYVKSLNEALDAFPDLQQRDAIWLLRNLRQIPSKIRELVRRNAGGHVNHSMYWMTLSPECSVLEPGKVSEAIDRDFGSLEEFKEKFESAGRALFGSGWVWLAHEFEDGGKLKIYTTYGHDNPVMNGRCPLLLNDVWEHAYYLKHESRRGEYLAEWWPLVNWKEVESRYMDQ